MSIGEEIRLPDDVTIGFIVEHILKVNLTLVEQFHSHLESMRYLTNLGDQVRIQFSFFSTRKLNFLVIKKRFLKCIKYKTHIHWIEF